MPTHECIDDHLINSTCLLANTTNYNMSGYCENAVVQVIYTIGWDASDITRVDVQFVYKTLFLTDLPVTQIFQTVFRKVR